MKAMDTINTYSVEHLLLSVTIGIRRDLQLRAYENYVIFVSVADLTETVELKLTLLQWRLFCDELDVLDAAINSIARGHIANFCQRLSGNVVLELKHPYCCIVIKSYEDTADWLKTVFNGVAIHFDEWLLLKDNMARINEQYNLNTQLACPVRGNHRNMAELWACCFCIE